MKHKYVPLTQQKYCCVPTVLQMILLRREMLSLNAEEIGYELGLTVPDPDKELLPLARTGEKPPAGWGTQIGKPEFSIEHFFEKFNIPLKYSYVPLSEISDVKSWILERFSEDDDLIACFNYSALYGGSGEGHVSLVESVENDEIVLVDPERNVPKFRTVKLADLIHSMEEHGEDNKAGFWLIKSL